MRFSDSLTLDEAPRRIGGGYLVAAARAVRTGVQLYTGDEVGKPEQRVVRVYRPAEEVFKEDSLRSFSHAPVTMGHPSVAVDAENWRELAVGEVSTDAVIEENKFVRLPLILKDSAAIQQVESGTSELSAGYTCDLVFEDGVTPEGDKYDAKQTNIRINHLAVVPRGRAGRECRIGDSAEAVNWGASPVIAEDHDMTMKPVVVGKSVAQVLATDASTIENYLADQERTHQAALAVKDAELADKDKQLAAKDAEIASLQAKVLSDADIEKRAAERAALVDRARSIVADYDAAGKTATQIKREVVVKQRAEYADKSDAYIDAMFDILAGQAADAAKTDPVLATLAQGARTNDAADDFGQAAYEQKLADAWKNVN